MGMTYIADELIFRIRETGQDKTKFIREAIEEKLNKNQLWMEGSTDKRNV